MVSYDVVMMTYGLNFRTVVVIRDIIMASTESSFDNSVGCSIVIHEVIITKQYSSIQIQFHT